MHKCINIELTNWLNRKILGSGLNNLRYSPEYLKEIRSFSFAK